MKVHFKAIVKHVRKAERNGLTTGLEQIDEEK